MKKLLVVALLLSPAIAGALPQPLGTAPEISVMPLGSKASPQYACVVGNEYNDNVGGYVSNHTGPESYAILIDPAACPSCDLGVTPTTVYFWQRLLGGASYQISLAVAEATDLGGGCYSPGAELLVYPPVTAPVVCCTGGWYLITPWTTGCLDPNRPYFLIFSMPETGTGVVGTYYDSDGVTPCRNWRNDGSGWVDIATIGFPGDLLFYAEMSCCSEPVSTDSANWGSLKSLFR